MFCSTSETFRANALSAEAASFDTWTTGSSKQRINLQLTCKITELIVVKSDISYTAIKAMKLIGSRIAAENKITIHCRKFPLKIKSSVQFIVAAILDLYSFILYLAAWSLVYVGQNKFQLSFPLFFIRERSSSQPKPVESSLLLITAVTLLSLSQ